MLQATQYAAAVATVAAVVAGAGKVASLLFLFCLASPLFSLFQSLLLFPPGLSDPVSVADLFGRLPGCSTGYAKSIGATHVWPVANTDPPCVVPPCHVSLRHVALIMH